MTDQAPPSKPKRRRTAATLDPLVEEAQATSRLADQTGEAASLAQAPRELDIVKRVQETLAQAPNLAGLAGDSGRNFALSGGLDAVRGIGLTAEQVAAVSKFAQQAPQLDPAVLEAAKRAVDVGAGRSYDRILESIDARRKEAAERPPLRVPDMPDATSRAGALLTNMVAEQRLANRQADDLLEAVRFQAEVGKRQEAALINVLAELVLSRGSADTWASRIAWLTVALVALTIVLAVPPILDFGRWLVLELVPWLVDRFWS